MNTEEYRLSFTAEEIDEKLGKIDNLAEKSQIPSKLSELIDDKGYALKSEIPEIDLSDYALSSEIPIDYLTSIPENYVTEEKLDAKGYLTEHQSLEGLATHEYVDDALAEKQPVGDYVLRSEIPECSSGAIIDVVELPTENINEGTFYRLMTGSYIYEQIVWDTFIVHCVESLPEAGLPATNADISMGNIYYSIADNEVYGYIDDMLSMGMNVPVGWYDGPTLLGALNYTYGGIITDINDVAEYDSCYVLIEKDLYIYQDGWCKVPFSYKKELAPKFDIQWDGVIGDRFALDLTSLGFSGFSFVKISDEVFNATELEGAIYTQYTGYEHTIDQYYSINSSTYPGALDVDDGVIIVYNSDNLNTALGLPSGYVTNGTYFVYDNNCTPANYTNRLVAPIKTKVAKISGEYLDVHNVAISGSWYDLTDRPNVYTDVVRYNSTQNLSSTYKANARSNIDVYSKSEVDAKIRNVDLSNYATKEYVDNLIGTAIGGSY